ncbi:hypothetical protein ACVWW7_005605 [Bradyrhizobium sp. LM6.9]
MSALEIDAIADADVEPVVALWQRCGLTRSVERSALGHRAGATARQFHDPDRSRRRRDRRDRHGRP